MRVMGGAGIESGNKSANLQLLWLKLENRKLEKTFPKKQSCNGNCGFTFFTNDTSDKETHGLGDTSVGLRPESLGVHDYGETSTKSEGIPGPKEFRSSETGFYF